MESVTGEFNRSPTQKREKMKITQFNKMVCEREGGEEQLTIAQVSEVIKIVNELTNGVLYNVIELIPTKCKKCSI